LKPERWGSQLVEKEYQGEEACDKKDDDDDDDGGGGNLFVNVLTQQP
jgi:hypothetical protein